MTFYIILFIFLFASIFLYRLFNTKMEITDEKLGEYWEYKQYSEYSENAIVYAVVGLIGYTVYILFFK